MGKVILILTIIFFQLNQFVNAQAYFRVEADFSIKENTVNGKEFYKGEVFFDKVINKVIYEVSFPERKTLVMADTQMYVLENKKVVSQNFTPNTNKFTIFNLALSGDLKNYGLDKAGYYINSIEESDDQTIIEWLPPEELSDKLGKAILSLKNEQLFGIVLFKPNGEIMGKRFYKNYTSVNGLPFPQQIIQVSYLYGEEYYKITTFSNIKIDESENDEMYRVDLID
ncbi:hypothetical protein SAMN05661096_03258 [Marivirga sericea]|uniref:Outer membrane lipoprotein-sorting protein n=1 Tax=Marivirga sericea TaxID=1028 RepID=A0A1X7KXM4_9BACT|nr:hypothetical protein [Marivirga sericea]SMG46316.1 hypothetical protein SAMN05661096_03258 [Marivirga sericea]